VGVTWVGRVGIGHEQWNSCREHPPKMLLWGVQMGTWSAQKQVQGESCFLQPLLRESNTFASQPPLTLTKKLVREPISPKVSFFQFLAPSRTPKKQLRPN